MKVAEGRERQTAARELPLIVRAGEVVVTRIFAADLEPIDPGATTARVTLPWVTHSTSLRDSRFEPTVTICSLEPSASARGGDECPTSLVDHGVKPSLCM